MQTDEQFLRINVLANSPAIPEKTVTDKKTGKKRVIKAKPAKQGIIGFSAKHIYHLIANNQFPKPIKIGRASLWRLSDINNWFKQHTNQQIEG